MLKLIVKLEKKTQIDVFLKEDSVKSLLEKPESIIGVCFLYGTLERR